jgi:hypothetical protein
VHPSQRPRITATPLDAPFPDADTDTTVLAATRDFQQPDSRKQVVHVLSVHPVVTSASHDIKEKVGPVAQAAGVHKRTRTQLQDITFVSNIVPTNISGKARQVAIPVYPSLALFRV